MSINSPKNKKGLYNLPIIEAVNRLDHRKSNKVFLLGGEGYGKTEVLNAYASRNRDLSNPIINATAEYDKYISIIDFEVSNLYQLIMIIKNILDYIKRTMPEKYPAFLEFEAEIKKIMANINSIYTFSHYNFKYNTIGQELCQSPEVLLERLLSICTHELDYQTITIIIDNFDTFGNNSPRRRYQELIHNLLTKYLRVVMTISDSTVLSNPVIIESLSNSNELVTIDYSKDIAIVKEILDSVFAIEIKSGYHLNKVGKILSDETVALMIQKTKGNLFDMIRALRELYSRLNELTRVEYDTFVLNYIDKVINKSPILTGEIKRERTLFIR